MDASTEYLAMQVETATQGQKLIMLHDGLIKFARFAIKGIQDKKYDVASTNLGHAQKIALHLRSSLDLTQTPELTRNLDNLYAYWYRKLVEANTTKSIDAIQEVVSLVKQMRDSWSELETKLNQERDGEF